MGVNLPPVANAGPDQTVALGAAVTLTGAGSSDPNGDALTCAWSQTGGTAVTLSGATTATPSFTAPAASATLTFSLTVSDGTLQSTADTVVVNVSAPNMAPQGTPVAFIMSPTGGGNKDLNVIRDGVKPPVGSTADNQQYDTYAGGGPRSLDWVGYTFSSNRAFNRVVFQEGKNFGDGGFFTTLTVEVRQGSTWSAVPGVVVTPAYSGGNGVHYETFQFTFPAITGNGIRISGTPGGSARFISVGELEVYGN
jgi:hypothetical protein